MHLDSAAVVIGAMIIAPLMHPLVALSIQIITANMRGIQTVSITIAVGVFIALITSIVLSLMIGSLEPTAEILSRIRPNILDLGVTLFAGATAAYARTDEKLSQSIAGVAISVALMPPLCVIGYEIAHGDIRGIVGSTLLFITNLNGIILASCIVFLFSGYHVFTKTWQWLKVALISTVVIIIPLSFSSLDLYKTLKLKKEVKEILKSQTLTFRNVDLFSLDIIKLPKRKYEARAVIKTRKKITSPQIKMVEGVLRKRTHQDIMLIIEAIPTVTITSDGA